MLLLVAQANMDNSALVSIILFLSLLAMIPLGIWVWILVDCISNEAPGSSEKTTWTVIIIIFGLIGAMAYSVRRRKKRIRELGR